MQNLSYWDSMIQSYDTALWICAVVFVVGLAIGVPKLIRAHREAKRATRKYNEVESRWNKQLGIE